MSEIIKSRQYQSAVEIDQRIKTTAKALAENLFDLCGLFYRMSSEKLYKELGYQTFADYCENEVGIKRTQGFKYATIGEGFKNQNVQSTEHFEAIGTEKLYLLARLDEPEQEKIQQTVNVEDVSVRELKAEIARLKEANASAEADLRETRAALLDTENNLNQTDEALVMAQSEKEKLKWQLECRQTELDNTREQITELKNRPVEVAVQVQDNPEDKRTIEQLKRNLSDKDKIHAAEMEEQQRQFAEDNRQFAAEQQRLNREYVNKISELEQKLSAAQQEQASAADIFKVHYKTAINAFQSMLEFIAAQPEKDKDFCLSKSANLLAALQEKLTTIRSENNA